MCFTRKLIFTVCAHYTVQLIECEKFHSNPDKTGRHACISPLCQHSQSLVTILGFCGACKDAYTGLKVAKINASQILWNFWCFKAAQKWNCAVDPSRVPVAALTSPAKTLHKSWFGYVRTYKEVSLDMIMAVSVQSLLDAFGQPVRATLCTMCRANHYMDLNRIAVGMAEATISWAHGLRYPEAVFESYQTHHHHRTEEVGVAAASGDQLPTTRHQPPVQQARQKQPSMSSVPDNKVFPRRPPAGDPARHTKRVNAKARRDAVIQERGDMLETLEAGHDERMAELQARVDLNDRRVSADTWMMRTFGSPASHSPSRSADQNTNNRSSGTSRVLFSQTSPYSSPSGGEFEGFSGAWEHEQDDAQANNNPKPSWPVRRANKRLRYPAHTYDNVIGEYDDALFEQPQARRSQYGEIVDPDDMSLDEGPDPRARFSFVPSPPSHFVGEVRRVRRDKDELADMQGQSASDGGMVDEHIDFYLDDDSVSVTGRVRPLTYVSPESSCDGSNTSSPRPPSPPSPRHNAAALPGIPPVSPLTFSSEFSFMADRADRSGTSPYREGLPFDASRSGCSKDAAGPALKGGLGEDTFGPLSRKSSGVAPLLGPDIRDVAPPRPRRNPKLCVTHGAVTNTVCRGCQDGALQEVALRPGTRVKQPEPEQF
ncbi:hypothetical protein CH63R_07644 [Colletotrichum higginsianum IMI 349063]|uniref:Uncharacterized protein n=2 Tax=Colletotrichum higginsianum (strain IMI 349063) TaxID=759273 RepID=A0A1B7Y9Z4_COLHI|nr:hypothetical protein CH63R_07644 [Colletotrichum higginsianum IMI 349063]OBR08879.1 hypothetical protein CH63R_07644 [Colletotrichum higginsianum IMI 349063]